MRLVRGACCALVFVLSIASGAHANWLQGTLYCDSDFSRTFSAGDTPLDGVKIGITAQTSLPGQQGNDISGDAIPQSPAVPGFYKIFLPARIEDWLVVLPGPGLPPGASIILPASGSYLAHIDPSTPATNHVDGLNFLIDCNPPPLCQGDASCDDHNPCTDDHCDPHTGCSHSNNTSPCDDGNACTGGDACADGQCQPGAPLSCDDQNPCTDEVCDQQRGCVVTNNSNQCDDGDACTTGDVCSDGRCQPGTPVVCDDNNICTDDSCDPQVGCVFKDNSARCSDGNQCNGIEVCVPGVGCQPGPPPYFAKTLARFGNLSQITADVGTNDPGGLLRLGRGAHMADGTYAIGDTVSISNAASIFKAFTNKLTTGAGATVRDGTSPGVFPMLEPFCVIPTLTCGGPDVVIGARADGGVLPPGSYGRLVLAAGASLTLAGGEYHFCSIKTSRGVDILVQGGSVSTIDVVGNVLIADLGTIHTDSGTPLPTLRVGGTAVRFGSNSDIFVNLLAPAAHLTIGRLGHLAGTFCFTTSSTDKAVRLDCPPLTPTS